VDSFDPLIARAWELCYLDPLQAAELGRSVAADGGPLAHEGWLQVALAEVRVGDVSQASAALQWARRGFADQADDTGLALCDEVQAVVLRRAGETAASAQLQAAIDARPGLQLAPIHRFIGHNSRAITAKLLGQHDEALRHFYAAMDSAARTGWPGPQITALSNLGGYHQDLYNLDDARRLTEQALAQAREVGVRQVIATSAINLVIVYHAVGEFQQSRAMVEFLVTHPEDLLPGALERAANTLAMGHLGVGEIDAAMRYLEGGAVTALADGDGITQWAWLKARCLLARGDVDGARRVAETTLNQRRDELRIDQPFDMMALHRVLADACEAKGDSVAALAYMRQAHALYEHLVGRSARARYIALQVAHELTEAQRERDLAMDTRRTVEDDHRRLAELNAALQAQAAETEMLYTKLREQALRDPLTGLHNRRYLFEIAPGLLELARRQSSPLCVVLMDLDHFKLLNDTYGHHAGDLVLQRFSALLTQMLRRSDVVCRHGGEEFVAVMPDIDTAGAEVVINRLLEAFQSQQTEMGKRRLPRGSFSAGIAVFPRNGHTLEQLLSRADRGLYAAKNQGRARIELAPGTGFGTLI
jgi:diguanylate cyclase (GGDEF)-like protein